MEDQKQQILQNATIAQQQLQAIMAQREAIGIQVLELKKATEELDKSDEKEVYKIAGPILIKSKKAAVLKELKEKSETFELRLNTLEREEKKFKLKIEEFREKLVSGMKT